jgi:ferredoxin
MKIFYFTATGNCLEVAKKLGGNIISIPAVLKGNIRIVEDDVIGIITPNYHGAPPEPVQEFLQKVSLHAPYIFGVVTYGEFNADANRVLVESGEKNGIHFDYINSIKMLDNSFVYFDMAKQKRNLPKKQIPLQLRRLQEDIEERKSAYHGIHMRNKVLARLIHYLPHDTYFADKFHIEKDKCIGCGICAKVCPIDNITLQNGVVEIRERCIRCGACTHHCPKNAIRYRGEKSTERFRNEHVSLQEIIHANSSVLRIGK